MKKQPHTFTIREAEFIRENWQTLSDREIGECLGLNHIQVRNFRFRNGLRGKTINKGQFKKGLNPWNKGEKGFHPGGRSRETQFPKGNQPHNTLQDGAERIRQKKGEAPYRYRRIALGKWRLAHHLNWEAQNGPIPKGCVLRCKDGNTLNCEPSNWECITRSEHLSRNHNRKKAAASLQKVYEKERVRKKYGLEGQTGLYDRIKHY